MLWRRGKPGTRRREQAVLVLTHEHRVQHRIVRDEHVGWCRHHVPPHEQLVSAGVGELGQIVWCGPTGHQQLELLGDVTHLASHLTDDVGSLLGGPRRAEGDSGVAPEPERPVRHPLADHSDRPAEPRHLVLDQGVRGVEHEGTCGGRTPFMPTGRLPDQGVVGLPYRRRRRLRSPRQRLFHQAQEGREQETLGLARAGARCDHHVAPVGAVSREVVGDRGCLVVPQPDWLVCWGEGAEQRAAHEFCCSVADPNLTRHFEEGHLGVVGQYRLEEGLTQ